MVLSGRNLFGDRRGIPIEERAIVTRDNGAISLVKLGAETKYWSVDGCSFQAFSNTIAFTKQTDGCLLNGTNTARYFCQVNLPQGAVITACIVYIDLVDGSETWTLEKKGIGTVGASTQIATNNYNTERTGLSETVNNATTAYFLFTSTIDTGDKMVGARITYTLTPSTIGGTLGIAGTAYAGETQRLRGFKTVYTINNHYGASQNYDFNIANTTKGTTLLNVTGLTLINGAYRTASHLWSTDEVSAGDTLTFTITAGYIGSSGAGNLIGYASFFVESVEETDEVT